MVIEVAKSGNEFFRQLREGTTVPLLTSPVAACEPTDLYSAQRRRPAGENSGVNALFINVRSRSGNKGTTFEHRAPPSPPHPPAPLKPKSGANRE